MRTFLLLVIFSNPVSAALYYGGRADVFQEKATYCIHVDLSAASALGEMAGEAATYGRNLHCDFNLEKRATDCYFRVDFKGRPVVSRGLGCHRATKPVVDGLAGVAITGNRATVRIGSRAGLWLASQWFPSETVQNLSPVENEDLFCRHARIGKLHQRGYSCYFGFTDGGETNRITGADLTRLSATGQSD